MKKILITGGCGFIGTNLINHLKNKHNNLHITVMDDFSTSHSDNIKLVKEKCDDFFPHSISEINSFADFDLVIHLAADTNVIDSIENPLFNFHINTNGTFNLLNICKETGIKKFIFASTGGAIQGETKELLKEDDTCKPISPYGASKLAGEAYCSAFAGSYDMNCIALRFTNVYGSYSQKKDTVISKFFKNILNDESLYIYGNGKQIRDYVHVDDICKGIELACFSNIKGFEAINLASGQDNSIIDLVEKIEKVTGKKLEVINKPKRKGEILKNFVSIRKARKLLDYNPSIMLKEGLEKTWNMIQ